MDDSFNFFNNAFSKISDLKKVDLSNKIIVKNSQNVTITGNDFNQLFMCIFDGFAKSIDDYPVPSSGIEFKSSIVNDKTERANLNIEYLEKFIFECNKKNIVPTIRCYAFFSHISSIRDRGNPNEYNQLILKEKDLFDKMLYLKFRVKLIISLDIPIILVKWYDNITETIYRITDLSDKIDDVCDKNNIEVVIDENDSLNGQFILHDCLLIRALNADPINKYNITEYETNRNVIKNAIKVFDQRFNYLLLSNNLVKKHIRTSVMSAFIQKTVDCRLENMNAILSSK